MNNRTLWVCVSASLILTAGCKKPGWKAFWDTPDNLEQPATSESLENQVPDNPEKTLKGKELEEYLKTRVAILESENTDLKQRCESLQSEVNKLQFISQKCEEQLKILKMAAVERDYNKTKADKLTETIADLHEKLRIRQGMIDDLNKQLHSN